MRKMNIFEMEKEFNELIKHGQELIEKLKHEQKPVEEADENDIGKLCWFWDRDKNNKSIGVLTEILTDNPYSFCCRVGCFMHCCRLTPAEVAEITGYKVEE